MNILTVPQIQKIDDRTLYEYCQYVGRQARIWKNHFVALLPEVARRGLHKTHGFATIIEFAAQVGGVGKKTVEAIFQVEKLLNDKPMLKNLVPVVGVNKIRIVATIATNEKLENIQNNNCVQNLFAQNNSQSGQFPPGRSKREQVSFGLDEAVSFKLRLFKLKLEKEKKIALEWNDVICELLNRAGNDV
jgi:hypothetical protein